MKPARGFGLIELMITVAIVFLLTILASSSIATAINNSRTRSVVLRFVQDFSWLRAYAANGNHIVTLTLNTDCSWQATVDGQTDIDEAVAHTMSSNKLVNTTSNLSCSSTVPITLPITFQFTDRGFLSTVGSTTASFTFSNPKQTWPLQVLNSGTILMTKGAS